MRDHIKYLLKQSPFEQEVYFVGVQDCQKDVFVRTQVDFSWAVSHFSRPLLLLASRLPTYRQRWNIINNVSDEHGSGLERNSHGATFQSFLNQLGSDDVRTEAPAYVLAFNRLLDGVASNGDWREALAVFGIIELRFAEISAFFARLVIDRGWMDACNLTHYSLHAGLDVSHAEDFFELIEKEWETEEGKRQIASGLNLGDYAFLSLYNQIWLANR